MRLHLNTIHTKETSKLIVLTSLRLDYIRNLLRSIVFATSVLSVVVLIIRYWYKIKWRNLPIPKQIRNQFYNNDYTNLMRSHREKNFVSVMLFFDVLILIIHPPPFYEKGLWISENIKGSPYAEHAMYLVSDFIIGNILV